MITMRRATLVLCVAITGALALACHDTESPPPPSCTLSTAADSLSFFAGITTALHAEASCIDVARPTVRWASSDPAIATIDSLTGLLSAVAAGRTLVTVSIPGRASRALVVRVAPPCVLPAVGPTLTPSALTLAVGGSERLSASVPVACAFGRDSAFVWTSLDTTIATVDSVTGVVTGRRSGQVAVRAVLLANRNVSSGVVVTVASRNVTGLSLTVSPDGLALPPWGTAKLDAVVTLPAGAPAGTSSGVAFRTSDSCGVRVAPDGSLSAGAVAFATVTAIALADTNVRVAVPISVPIRAPLAVSLVSVTSGGTPAAFGTLHGVTTFTFSVDGQLLTGGGRLELTIADRAAGAVTLPTVRGSAARVPASVTVDLDARDAGGTRLYAIGSQPYVAALTTGPGVSPFAGCGGLPPTLATIAGSLRITLANP